MSDLDKQERVGTVPDPRSSGLGWYQEGSLVSGGADREASGMGRAFSGLLSLSLGPPGASWGHVTMTIKDPAVFCLSLVEPHVLRGEKEGSGPKTKSSCVRNRIKAMIGGYQRGHLGVAHRLHPLHSWAGTASGEGGLAPTPELGHCHLA